MRSIVTFIVLLGVLSGTFFPFGNIPVAYAANIHNIFPAVPNWDINAGRKYMVSPRAISIPDTPTAQSTMAQIDVSITLRGGSTDDEEAEPATDDNNNKVFDLATLGGDSAGDWGDIIDSNKHQVDYRGFFIQIGTSIESIPNPTDPTLPAMEKLNGADTVTYGLSIPKTNTSLNPTDRRELNTSYQVDGKAYNIGYYIWEHAPDKFFKETNPVITVPVNGLKPDTQYWARVLVVANGTVGISTARSFSTKSAGQDQDPDTLDGGLIEENQTDDTRVNLFGQLIECDILAGEIAGCLLELFYDIVYSGSAMILLAAGKLFDVFVKLGIGSTMYERPTAEFVWVGWEIVRDIANIFFIFILLYSALALILGIHGFNVKKTIAKVIIIAILVNFSLFFARVTIDVSNVFARVFYNAVQRSDTEKPMVTSDPNLEEKSLSGGIMNGLNVQRMVSQDAFDALEKSEGGISSGRMFFILILGTALNLYAAFILFMCAVFFAGRIGVLWFSMIFVPLSLVSGIVPSLDKGLKQIGWSTWLSTFMKACFNAPIFLFFIYLIIKLAESVKFSQFIGNDTSGSLLPFLVAVCLPFMIIIGLLRSSKKIAEDMAGEFGSAFAGAFSAVVGGAAMLATGGAAIAGRGLIGSTMSKLSNSENLKDIAAGKKQMFSNTSAMGQFGNKFLGKGIAKTTLQTANAGKKASFDVRQTALGNSLSKATGVDMNIGAKIPLVGGALSSFSTASTAGGFEGMVNRKAAKEREFTETLGYDKHKYQEQEDKVKDQKDSLEKAQDIKIRLQDDIRIAKSNGDDVERIRLEGQVQEVNTYISNVKNGGEAPPVVVSGTGGWGDNLEPKDFRETDVRTGTTTNMSISKREKAMENMKKSRAKEYYNSKIKKSSMETHDETRDEFGNIKKMAHGTGKTDGKKLSKNLLKDFLAGVGTGAAAGTLVAPGLGTAVGGIGFGLAKLLRSSLVEESVGQARYEVAHLASDDTHKIHMPKDNYKSPSNDFFKNLGSGGGSGGGGAHDDHGGGGDDHGGGHH